jgi:hypothetical protein
MSQRLAQLHALLAQASATGRLTVTGAMLEAEHVAGQWLVLFGDADLTLSQAVVADYDDGGSVTVRGDADLLGFQRRAVTLVLFEARDASGIYEDSIEALLVFDAPVAEWRMGEWFGPPPYPWSTAAFPEMLSLRDAVLVVSSCDFAEPDGFTYSIEAPETDIVAPLGAGLNFRAVIAGYDAVLDPLRPIGIVPDQPVQGLIGEAQEGEGPQLGFFHRAEEADALASLSVSGLASFGLRVTELGCRGPIGAEARNFDAVSAAAEITVGEHVLDLEMLLSGSHAALSGSFDGDRMLTLADIEQGFGLPDVAALLPGPLKALGGIALVGFEAGLDLETLTLGRFAFEITTQEPWVLIGPEVLKIQPYVHVSREAGAEDTAIRIGGDWWIGETRFTVDLDPATGDFMAGMAVGETLDMGAMLDHFAFHLNRPDCVLLDLDIDGNVEDGVFSLRIETAGGWHFDIGGGAEIAIKDIELTARYGVGALTGHLAGDIVIAGWRLGVDLILDDACTFEVLIPELKVGELAESFLALVGLPVDIPDFTLTDTLITITPTNGLFSIAGTSATPVTLFSGFKARIARFSAERSGGEGERLVEAALELVFTIDGIDLMAAAEYRHVETGKAPESEWLFTLRQGETPLSLAGLVEALERMVGLSYPLAAGDLAIRDLTLSFTLGGADRRLAAAATVTSSGDAYATFRLVAEKRGTADWSHLVNVDVSLAGVDPARLPMVGPMLRGTGLRLETLRVTRASQAMSSDDGKRLKENVAKDIALPLPAVAGLDVSLLSSGLGNLPIGLQVANRHMSSDVPADGTVDGEILPPPAPAQVDETRWFAIDKGFGPFTLERLGFNFQNERLTLVFDSHVSLQGFTLSLAGLGLGTRLDRFDPSFRLDGIGLGFAAGPVSVSGAMLRRGADFYAGSVRLEAAGYAIGAIGEYAAPDASRPELGNATSMFVFGVLEAPLGGPPICYVRGVAAGLGINSSLRTPAVGEIQDFSLIQAALPGAGFGGMDLNAVLRAMDRDIHPMAGRQWLAAGLRFSSFELVHSVALLTVPLDRPENITLIGLSRLSMPPEAPNPIAMLEIGFTASVKPADGLVAIEGQLTRNSFLLSHDCHPTGGFAFYAWFAGAHEGDFVLTLGGYHPRFPKPDHFPNPRRLAMQWRLSSALAIKGTSYFALVPNAVMAGGTMEAVWESGPVRAWFNCGYDFLIQWKPFAYDVSISVEVGAEVSVDLWFTTITVGFSIGAGLRLHGPPFGGEVWIDLDIVSFTISFGPSRPDRAALDWGQFRQSFLPAQVVLPPGRALAFNDTGATNTVCLVRPSGGVMRDLSAEGGRLQWVLNNERLALEVVCVVPVKQAQVNGRALQGMPAAGWSAAVGIAPSLVLAERLQSALTVTLRHFDAASGGVAVVVEGIGAAPVLRPVPAALWCSQAGEGGRVPEPPLGGARVVEDALVGLTLKPRPIEIHATEDMPVADLQFDRATPLGFGWSRAQAPRGEEQAMLAALAAQNFALRPGVAGRRRFSHQPQQASLGATPA